jgi:hypothetical protein
MRAVGPDGKALDADAASDRIYGGPRSTDSRLRFFQPAAWG